MRRWLPFVVGCAVVTPDDLDGVLDPDGDGAPLAEDCDNLDSGVAPTLEEDRTDLVDNDCDGVVEIDPGLTAEDGVHSLLLDQTRRSCMGGVVEVVRQWVFVGAEQQAEPGGEAVLSVSLSPDGLDPRATYRGETQQSLGAALTVLPLEDETLDLLIGAPDRQDDPLVWRVPEAEWSQEGTASLADDANVLRPRATGGTDWGHTLGTALSPGVDAVFIGDRVDDNLRLAARIQGAENDVFLKLKDTDSARVVATAIDLGGDATGDMLVGLPDIEGGTGRLGVVVDFFEQFKLPSTVLPKPFEVEIRPSEPMELGASVEVWAAVPDSTADYFVVGAPGIGAVFVIDPLAIAAADVPDSLDIVDLDEVAIATVHGPGPGFGSSLASLDFDGDGVQELAIGSRGEEGDVLAAYVVELDRLEAVVDAQAQRVRIVVDHVGEDPGTAHCDPLLTVRSAGDLDGDSREELLVAAPAKNNYQGVLYMVEGF